MRGLNEWLEKEVHDRQAELRGVSARVDQLRRNIGRLVPGQPLGQSSLAPFLRASPHYQDAKPGPPFIVPPVPQVAPVVPQPPGFELPPGFVQQPLSVVPVVPFPVPRSGLGSGKRSDTDALFHTYHS
jgi:hypothetical protein